MMQRHWAQKVPANPINLETAIKGFWAKTTDSKSAIFWNIFIEYGYSPSIFKHRICWTVSPILGQQTVANPRIVPAIGARTNYRRI